ncbi:hypothetical protein FRB93_003403 [Tulasnella sp. JGI-2019a]|nr:hypothetical protein FRB93_003403 [Tulasnella sp. JGI-2019a]
MFGPFGGPLPKGIYTIAYTNTPRVLHVPSIVSHTVVNVSAFEEGNDAQVWVLEYGQKGYKIKHEISGNCLSYTPWATPARLIGQQNQITASADSPVEWELAQLSHSTNNPRTFQLRLVAGNKLQPTDDIVIGGDNSNGNIFLGGAANNSFFHFRAIGAIAGTVPSSLGIVDNTNCRIRSVYRPLITLEPRPSAGKLVVGRTVTDEGAQVWNLHSTTRGRFKITNVQSGEHLGHAVVPNTPANTQNQSMVYRDTSTEFMIVSSSEGYEIRLASDPTLIITIWNFDAGSNSWVYLDKRPSSGPAYTNQQWIFTAP